MSETLLEPIETIGTKFSISTWETIILVELPNRVFTYSWSMMSTKLGYPDGGGKTKVVLVGSNGVPSGLSSCPTTTNASIFLFIVLPILVSSDTALALWVEIIPTFRYRSAKFMGGVFLPPKWLEGTLVEMFGLVLRYLPFSVPRFVHERKEEKISLGLGEPAITDA
jgi:hypothetical protein